MKTLSSSLVFLAVVAQLVGCGGVLPQDEVAPVDEATATAEQQVTITPSCPTPGTVASVYCTYEGAGGGAVFGCKRTYDYKWVWHHSTTCPKSCRVTNYTSHTIECR